MTNLTAPFKCCQKKPKDGKNNIASHLYISAIPIDQTNGVNKVWYMLKNWIADERLPQDLLFVVQEHNTFAQYVYRVEEYHKYSCVHISSDSLFSKILKKPSIVQK